MQQVYLIVCGSLYLSVIFFQGAKALGEFVDSIRVSILLFGYFFFTGTLNASGMCEIYEEIKLLWCRMYSNNGVDWAKPLLVL